MPLPVIANVKRVTLNWTNASVPRAAANVIHLSSLSTDPAELFTALDAAFAAGINCLEAVSSGSKITSVDVLPLDGTSSTSTFVTGIDAHWSGGAGSNQPMTQVAGVVSLKTGERGQSKRGRIYLPWINEGEYVEGLILGTTLAQMQLAWELFLASLAGDNFPLVVASYKLGSAELVDTVTVRSRSGTQRKRNRA